MPTATSDTPDSVKPLNQLILEALQDKQGLKVLELAAALGRDRREVNRCLNVDLAGQVQQGSDYRWRLVQRDGQDAVSPADAGAEIYRLCRYYLECISHDLDEGVSVFARNHYGNPDYVQLASVPIGTDAEWWNTQGADRLLGKARAERGKVALWLGYPVRLRQHRTPRWEGYFVEPVLLWPIVVPEADSESPYIDEQAPMLNAKFMRSMAIGDGMQLAGEMARLSEELGLGRPAADLPEVLDLVERLVRIRADWGWQETIDPTACGLSPLAESGTTGIYNCAVIVAGERSPYTKGLESELSTLSSIDGDQLRQTALGQWLTGKTADSARESANLEPLVEVLPMNTEQRAAVNSALTANLTVITGPPGTGKSQVVTNLLVNAAWRDMRVLFASKNNKAVDVVEARVNGLGNRPVLLRLGSKAYQARLAAYIPQLLAGTSDRAVHANYEEGLKRHRSLTAQLSQLETQQQQTLNKRNTVDRLDQEADAARQLFGASFAGISEAARKQAEADLGALAAAVNGADPEQQPMHVKLLWKLLCARRIKRLAKAVQGAAGTFSALRMSMDAWQDSKNIETLRAQLSDLHRRVHALNKLMAYREALDALQSAPSFEDIARRKHELAEQVSQHAAKLWRDWVQLTPTRLNAMERKNVSDYAVALELLAGENGKSVHWSVRQQAQVLQSKVMSFFSCWAVTSLSARGRIPLEPGFYDLVVIDEASQCDIASALPLLFRAKRSVIIGDPKQLRHISTLTTQRDSELQHRHGLIGNRLGWMYSVNSLFDVAASVAPASSIINLRDHHRSHADIIGFSNKAFYEGSLRVATRYQNLKRPRATQPGIVWDDVRGTVERPRDGGARNVEEAYALVEALVDLLVARGYTGSVGVVTPFRAQALFIQSLIKERRELDAVAARAELLVDTVHKFQGDERDVMFFSPVVSRNIPDSALGFLRSNGNLFNVAITRARGLLHVVGDRKAAASCGVDYLEAFVEHVATLDAGRDAVDESAPVAVGSEYPAVAHPERVSEWERMLYRALVEAGLSPIPQHRVEQYDLDFALLANGKKLAIEVDGECYHRSWTGELCLRDQLRNQRLIELGWDVKRFWVYEVRDELRLCVQRIQAWVESVQANPRSVH